MQIMSFVPGFRFSLGQIWVADQRTKCLDTSNCPAPEKNSSLLYNSAYKSILWRLVRKVQNPRRLLEISPLETDCNPKVYGATWTN